MDIASLSASEKAKLMRELEAEAKAKKQREREDRESYKKMVSETVEAQFVELQRASESLAAAKAKVYASFAVAMQLKKELYGFDESQQSHSFTTLDGKKTIKIGHRVITRYDDTCKAGEMMIGEYLQALAINPETAAIVDLVHSLLSRDKEGNLNPARVLELKQFADKQQDEKLLRGIEIIIESYKPEKTKTFVEVLYRDDDNKECNLPLSIVNV